MSFNFKIHHLANSSFIHLESAGLGVGLDEGGDLLQELEGDQSTLFDGLPSLSPVGQSLPVGSILDRSVRQLFN